MRTLHVIEPWTAHARGSATTDAGVVFCADAIHRLGGEACVIGTQDAEDRAGALGVHTHNRLSAPLGEAPRAWRGLAALARVRGPFGAVPCWSEGAAHAAFTAGLPSVDRRAWWPDAGIAARASDLLWPDRVAARRRDRSSLGIDDRTPAVLLLADPPDRGDAWWFTAMLALLHKAGKAWVGVASSASWRSDRAAPYLDALECPGPLFFTDRPPLAMLPACDAVVIAPARPGDPPDARLTTARRFGAELAATIGVPVVAGPSDTPWPGGVVTAPAWDHVSIARRLLALSPARGGDNP
ncbi:MAG: hypothetical protein HRU70_03320 [Phycisphaeraceae bacterium]|nr:MAG: hypothetical protein HRU70_03320 [Phycisphaeraceae bacterium]